MHKSASEGDEQSSAVSLVCAIPLISPGFVHGYHLGHTLNSTLISGSLCHQMYNAVGLGKNKKEMKGPERFFNRERQN